MTHTHTGQCLCGKTQFQIKAPLDTVIGCHCGQCRRWTSSYVLATRCLQSDFVCTSSSTLKWVDVSSTAKRGFCKCCGSNLFWQAHDSDLISIIVGVLDDDTELKLGCHIFTADAPDFYDITGDVKKFPASQRSANQLKTEAHSASPVPNSRDLS